MLKITSFDAFPNVALFTVLIVMIVYLYTKHGLMSVIVGITVFYFGINGYLEEFGIGINKCMIK